MSNLYIRYPSNPGTAIPTGSATAANQLTEISYLTTIANNTAQLATAQPVSQSGTWTVSLSPGSTTIGKVDQGNAGSSAQSWYTNLSQVGGASFALGQQLAAASLPVVLTASQLSTLTPLSTVAATQSGTWNVGLNAGTNAIGSITNTSFIATQSTASNLNATVVGNTSAGSGAATGLVTVQGNAAGTPVPVSGTVTITPSGTQSVNLSQVGGTSFALGQQLAAASLPVVLTAAQLSTLTPLSTVAATQSGTWNINNISGTVSLPTGASTSANQTNGTQKTQIVDGSGNVIGSTANALNVYFAGGGIAFSNGQVSLLNSSTTPLAANGVFTGFSTDLTSYSAVTVNLATDQSGTLSFQFSSNGTNWDQLENQTVTISPAGTTQAFFWSLAVEARYFRVVYTNGPTHQGVFRLQTVYKTFPSTGDISALSQTPIAANNALSTKSVIYGLTTGGGGGYVPTKVTPSGALSIAVGDISGIVGQQTMANSVPVVIASNQSAIPVSQSGTWDINNINGTVSLPTGASTAALQTAGNASLSSIDTKTPTLGQKTMSGSQPVVIASDQSAITTAFSDVTASGNITGTQTVVVSTNGANTVGFQITGTYTGQLFTEGTVDGTNWVAIVSVLTGTGGANSVFVASTGVGQASVSGLSSFRIRGNVITGTADVTLRANATTAVVDNNLAMVGGANFAQGSRPTTNSLSVTLASDQSPIAVSQSGTWNINNVSGTVSLPTGASTSALQTTANSTLTTISGQLPGTLGQKTMANSLAVTLASDQSNINVTQGGKIQANNPVVTSYSSTNVTSGAYVQIVASTTTAINLVEIFDSSGVALYFATGGAGSEVNQFVIYPGGNGQVPFAIPQGTRLSLKAVSTSATSGTGIINFYT